MSTIFEVFAVSKKSRVIVKRFYVRCKPELENCGNQEACVEAMQRVESLNDKEDEDGEPMYDSFSCELSVAPVEFECNGIEMID